MKEWERIVRAIRQQWPRLLAEIEAEPAQAQAQFEATREAARMFKDFTDQTLESWSRPRRVVGKAEHLEKGAHPRFVVTEWAQAECGTIRSPWLKIGAQIRVTVRKVWVSWAESCPFRVRLGRVYENRCRVPPRPLRCGACSRGGTGVPEAWGSRRGSARNAVLDPGQPVFRLKGSRTNNVNDVSYWITAARQQQIVYLLSRTPATMRIA